MIEELLGRDKDYLRGPHGESDKHRQEHVLNPKRREELASKHPSASQITKVLAMIEQSERKYEEMRERAQMLDQERTELMLQINELCFVQQEHEKKFSEILDGFQEYINRGNNAPGKARQALPEGSATEALLRDVEALFEEGRAADAVAAWRSANYTPLYFSARSPDYMREALMLKDEELDALQLLVPIGAVNHSDAVSVEPYGEAPKPHNQPSAPCLSVSACPMRKRSPGERNSGTNRSGSGNRLRPESTPKTSATEHPL